MHYVAPCFAFNLAEIGALLCGFSGYQAYARQASGLVFMSITSGVVATAFGVAAVILAWNS